MTKFEEMLAKGSVKVDTSPRGLLEQKVREHIRKFGKIEGIEGVYADRQVESSAFVEEIIRPEKGGTFSKLFGCSYLFPGEVKKDLIDRVATIKGVWMEDLRFLFGLKWFILPALPLLFFQKKLIKAIVLRYAMIYEKDLVKWQLPDKAYNAVPREILRVTLKIVDSLDKSWDKIAHGSHGFGYPYREAARKLAYCLPLFLNTDFAYGSRVQDALWAAGKNIERFFKILIERENQDVVYKFKMIKLCLFWGKLLFPGFRRGLQFFLNELDLNQVEPTEADRFFTLRREGYNYGGMSLPIRKKRWEEINREKGHIIFNL